MLKQSCTSKFRSLTRGSRGKSSNVSISIANVPIRNPQYPNSRSQPEPQQSPPEVDHTTVVNGFTGNIGVMLIRQYAEFIHARSANGIDERSPNRADNPAIHKRTAVEYTADTPQVTNCAANI